MARTLAFHTHADINVASGAFRDARSKPAIRVQIPTGAYENHRFSGTCRHRTKVKQPTGADFSLQHAEHRQAAFSVQNTDKQQTAFRTQTSSSSYILVKVVDDYRDIFLCLEFL